MAGEFVIQQVRGNDWLIMKMPKSKPLWLSIPLAKVLVGHETVLDDFSSMELEIEGKYLLTTRDWFVWEWEQRPFIRMRDFDRALSLSMVRVVLRHFEDIKKFAKGEITSGKRAEGLQSMAERFNNTPFWGSKK